MKPVGIVSGEALTLHAPIQILKHAEKDTKRRNISDYKE